MFAAVRRRKSGDRVARPLVGLAVCALVGLGVWSVAVAPANATLGASAVRWRPLLEAVAALVALALVGAPIAASGARRLRHGEADADAVAVPAIAACWVVGIGLPSIATPAVGSVLAIRLLLLLALARALEGAARAVGEPALRTLALPAAVRIEDATGDRRVALSEVRPGDRVVVRAGERVPIDGLVVRGEARVQGQALTGDGLPFDRRPGDAVSVGMVCLDANLLVEARRVGEDVSARRLCDVAERAIAAPEPRALPASALPLGLLTVAAATFLAWWPGAGVHLAAGRALAVLLVACPAAVTGVGGLARGFVLWRALAEGVALRGREATSTLAEASRAFLEWSGVVTVGRPEVVAVESVCGVEQEEVLSLAAGLEAGEDHPVARAVANAAEAARVTPVDAQERRTMPGRGIAARVAHGRAQRSVRVGSADFAAGAPAAAASGGPWVHVSVDGRDLGRLLLRDPERPSARRAIAALSQLVAVDVITSWPQSALVPAPADLGTAVASGLRPEEKMERVVAARRRGEVPILVTGRGSVAASLGARAAACVTLEPDHDLARELSEVHILAGRLDRLPWLIALCRHAADLHRRALMVGLAANALGLCAAALGWVGPLAAAWSSLAAAALALGYGRRALSYRPALDS